jgi:spore germination protein KB
MISTKQLMFSVAAFIIASTMLTSFLYTYTKNETWIPVTLAAAFSYAVASIYGRLAKNHAGLSLVEINDAVFGRIAGKIVSALYVFYFFTLVVLNTRDLGGFVSGFILQNTPISITYVVFLFLCSYAARKGAVSMTRYAVLLTIIYIAAVVFNLLLLINRIHLENLRPVFMAPLKNYLLGTHIVAMLPFCEVLTFLMFVPYLQKPDEAGKAFRRGIVLAFCVMLVIVLRDIVVLGKYSLYASSPTYSSIRLIDVGDILTRLEIVFAVMLMTMLFFKVSILFFTTVKALSQLLHIKDYSIFVNILVALCAVYSNAMFSSSFEHTQWTNTAAVYSTFFVLLLPLATLIVSEVQKKVRLKAEVEPLKMN